MLFTIDQWLIAKTEYFADWFQQLTGKDNYSLCRIMLCLWTSLFVFDGILIPSNTVIVYGAMVFIILMPASYYCENDCKEKAANGLANETKIISFWSRIANVFCLVMLSVYDLYRSVFYSVIKPESISLLVALVFFVLYLYFLACDTKPPCKSLLRRWLESFKSEPEAVPVPVPIKS